MNIVTTINEWQSIRKNLKSKQIGFIPTMGNLHEGHLSLCKRAQSENEMVVVSIFVNPTQFDQKKDFDTYPRTWDQDKQLLDLHHVDYLLMPEAGSLYPDQYEVQVSEQVIAKELEGESRPGHFNGMLTIVLKLLNLISPHRAYFGEKDYQQLLLVKKMVQALFLSVEIIGCPTLRASDGLALSSRNSRLNAQQREKASLFSKLLKSDKSADKITQELTQLGFKVDYIQEKWGRRLGAVWLDDIRLIDNILVLSEGTNV